jgi:hypothetical protein
VGDRTAGVSHAGESLLMIAGASTVGSGSPKRILTLPDDGPIFGYWLVFLQILGPNTIFIGTNSQEAGAQQNDGVLQDGLQFNQTNTNDGAVYSFLWKGSLWVSASANNTQFVIVVPGMEKANLPCDLTTNV